MKILATAAAIVATILNGTIAMAGFAEDHIKVVQRFSSAYGNNDLEGIAAVMDENVQWHIPGRHPLS